MQRICIALSALISRKQYRLQAASKVPKLKDRSRNSVGSEFQTVGPCHRESPTAKCNPPTARCSQLMLVG